MLMVFGKKRAERLDREGANSARSRTLWGDAIKRLMKNRLAVVAFVWIAFMVIIAVTGRFWVPYVFGDVVYTDSQTANQMKFLPPSFAHPFGTDLLGRDTLGRIVYGAITSLSIGLFATLISTTIGVVLGSLAGYFGGFFDALIMRFTDMFMAVPYTLFTIALLAILGPGWLNIFIAIGLLGWTSICRVVRAAVMQIKQSDYIAAARALGASNLRIVLRHILPNSMASVVVYSTMSIGSAILTEAALSFLGLGIQRPQPAWGLMISEGQTYLTQAPWIVIGPGIAILTTVLAFTLLGDGLRDALDVKGN